MARTPDGGEQLALPFPTTRAARARRGARRAGAALARVLAVALRWVLRIALPLLSAAALLQAFPYHATVQGVPFQVQGSLFSRPGLSADTTLGSWEFPEVSGVPFGVHLSPEDVDVLQLTRLAAGDVPAFVQRLQAGFTDRLPRIAGWLIGEFLLGVLVGVAVAAALEMSVRYLRGRRRREHELRHRFLQLGVAGAVVAVVAGYGVLTYNPNWVRESRLTGTLAAAQLFPGELSAYYSQQSKALDVLGSVVGIQAALQAQIDDERTPATALRIMTISDMHLAANYPLVAQYAANYDVHLIVNAGDESEFGTSAELTSAYLDGLRAVAATTPVLWIPGNHDSPATEQVLRGIPGVTVLGTKTAATGGGYRVTAGAVQAYGLTIAGLGDPRVYGAAGAYGSDDESVTDPLEEEAVAEALGGGTPDGATQDGATQDGATQGGAAAGTTSADATSPDPVDVFVAHEPVAAAAVREQLPGMVRQTVSGHVHEQNDSTDLQDGDAIDLVEGSTGAGGLDNIVRGTERPPIQFSIESVGEDCQFTRVVRFSIAATADLGTAASTGTTPQAYGDDVTASTVYFRPQDVDPDRTCGTSLGIGAEQPWPGS